MKSLVMSSDPKNLLQVEVTFNLIKRLKRGPDHEDLFRLKAYIFYCCQSGLFGDLGECAYYIEATECIEDLVPRGWRIHFSTSEKEGVIIAFNIAPVDPEDPDGSWLERNEKSLSAAARVLGTVIRASAGLPPLE